MPGDAVGVAVFDGLGAQFEGLEAGVGFCDAEAGAPFAADEFGEHALPLFGRGEFGYWLCCVDILKLRVSGGGKEVEYWACLLA